MRYLAVLAVICFGIVAFAVPAYLGPDDIADCDGLTPVGLCARADAIIAVSGGDTAARVAEAVTLYQRGWAPTLIFSGAAADPNGPSNAEVMQRIAITAGIDPSAIVIEEFSRTTAENALNTSAFIAKNNIKRVIIVTSAYHQRRALLEFSANLGPSVTIVNHPTRDDARWNGAWWWTSQRGWWLAGSEIVKIIAFYAGQGANRL